MMISWQSFQIGNVVCAAYPLTVVDTIDVHTGELNERSALNMIVFGVGKSMLNPVDIVDDDPEERSPSGHDRGGGRGLSESQVERFHRRQVFFFFKFDTNTLCQRSKFAQTLDILSFVKQFVCYLLFLGITVAAFGLRSIETKVSNSFVGVSN